MKIPKKGTRSTKLYRKVYTGYVCRMTDEPEYTWEVADITLEQYKHAVSLCKYKEKQIMRERKRRIRAEKKSD